MSRKFARGSLLTVAVLGAALLAPMAGAAADPVDAPVADAGALQVDPAVEFTMEQYGVSQAEAERRIKLQEAASAFNEFATASFSKTYGGLWIDQQVGQVVIAGAARDLDALSREAAGQGLTGVRTVAVARSIAALLDLREELQRAAGSSLLSYLDIKQNRIALADPQLPEPAAAFRAKHADAFVTDPQLSTVRLQACQFPYCDAPLRAGVGIIPKGYTSFQCTNAFNVRSKSDGKYFSLTAGHCVDSFPGYTWQTRFATGAYHDLGARHNDTYPGVDAAIVNLLNPTGWSPGPRVVVWGGKGLTQNDNYGISGQGVAAYGATVCHSGAKSGSKCGTAEQFNVTVGNSTGTVGVKMAGGRCTEGGDSGGPWWANGRAYGIHTAGTDPTLATCMSYYTRVDDAMNGLNVRLITTTNP